jgi:hypothetical protein
MFLLGAAKEASPFSCCSLVTSYSEMMANTRRSSSVENGQAVLFLFCADASTVMVVGIGWKWPKRCQPIRWNAWLLNWDVTLVSITLPLGHGQAIEVKPCVGEAVNR